MDRKVWIGTGSGLVVGFIFGAMVGTMKRPDASRVPAPLATEQPQPAQGGGMPPGAVPPMGQPNQEEVLQHVRLAEAAVAQDPKNLQAWIALGNGYFDSHQFQKSVDAYGKALALDPKNPDVLTDQGLMYRELKQFKKAIDNFEKASKLDPNHAQSRLNLGVVFAEDMNQPDRAIQVWTKLIEALPGTPSAEKARLAIQSLKAHGKP